MPVGALIGYLHHQAIKDVIDYAKSQVLEDEFQLPAPFHYRQIWFEIT